MTGSAASAVDGIEPARLVPWLEANLEGATPPFSFELIAGGRSNLTYSVTDAAGRRWALRRPPLGKRLGSAHDMGREYRVGSALAGTPVPVAPIAGFCEDEEINGAPFYVMEFLDGPVLRSPADAALFSREERRTISENTVDTLAVIHAVDPDAAGLGDLGKKADYVARTLKRWLGQWEKSKTRDLPLIEDLHSRLSARVPEQEGATIVHGDYRLDNVILGAGGSVAAVLDWELSTLGDPLADVGLLLVYWSEPEDDFAPLVEPATMAPGFLSRDEVKERYSQRSGRDLSGIDYYVALGYWRLAIILEGVFARFAAGQHGAEAAKSDEAAELAGTVERLAVAADDAERRLD